MGTCRIFELFNLIFDAGHFAAKSTVNSACGALPAPADLYDGKASVLKSLMLSANCGGASQYAGKRRGGGGADASAIGQKSCKTDCFRTIAVLFQKLFYTVQLINYIFFSLKKCESAIIGLKPA